MLEVPFFSSPLFSVQLNLAIKKKIEPYVIPCCVLIGPSQYEKAVSSLASLELASS